MMEYVSYYESLNDFEKKFAPKDLFYAGDFSLIEKGRRVSVVGSRNASEDGIKRCSRIVSLLVEKEIIVVSGLANGIDTTAHKTAIEKKGKTIAVLPCPLSQCTPVSNSELLQSIKKDHLAISQFKEGSRIFKGNFIERNRTMALISDATIIIEASEESGTRHQGWEAIRLGRQLIILESVYNSVNWAKEMMDYGAIVLNNENYKEIIESIPYYTEIFDLVF